MSGLDAARKASRLARLLDDEEAMSWLTYETAGYPGTLDAAAAAAATRSGRGTATEAGAPAFWTSPLGTLELGVKEVVAELGGLSAPGASGDSAFPVEIQRQRERSLLRARVEADKTLLDKVVAAIHSYAANVKRKQDHRDRVMQDHPTMVWISVR